MPRSAVSLVRLMPASENATPDAELLRALVAARGEEVFAEIVRRHGPMVLAACRRVLGHADDADDAFQAVFLVLARKATTIRGANLAGWLYAVAVRTARGVRIMRDRRRSTRSQGTGDRSQKSETGSSLSPVSCLLSPERSPDSGLLTTELAAVIDEELARLPDCYREAVVLCELRGLSRKQAAAEIGIPEGTLSSRLAAAKRKLAARLSARGLSVPAALAAVLAPASVSASLVRSAVAATQGVAAPVASAAAAAVVKAMLFDQLRSVVLAAGVLLTVACGSWAMTGSPSGDNPAPVSAKPAPEDPAVKLVARLGAEDFADREAAEKELRKLGPKAEAALKDGLKSESPEVAKRCRELLAQLARAEFDTKHWARFAKVIGDDKASRALFERIRSLRRNVELLDAVAADPKAAGKLYHDRWAELNKAARIPTGVGSYQHVPAPLADVVGWMYLGTFPGAEGTFHTSHSLDFLPYGKHSGDALTPALTDETVAAPLRRLVGTWTAARVDYCGREYGFQLALWYDIKEVLPAARQTVAAKVRDDPYPGNTARNVGFALLVVGKLGTKDDLPLLERYAKDETGCAVFLNDPPEKPGQPVIRLRRLPVEGQDATTQLRDASAAMRLHLLGQNSDDFGFYWRWPHGPDAGKPTGLGAFYLNAIGFLRDADREAAHKKAREWLDKQKNDEPKREEPTAGLLRDLADLDSLRNGEQTDFAAVEKRGGELLAKYPGAVDRGRIYSMLTLVYSNSGITRTFARVTKYGRLALEHTKDPVSRGQVFSYLASAAEVAVAPGDPLSDDPFAVKRKRSADILLEGYRELLPLKLPAVAPELPGVEKIGGLLDGADPAEEARIRERHAAQLKARRDAEFFRDMVHHRDAYATQLKYLYGREPKADDELRKVVEGALKDPKAAADLLDRVAKSR
jgi:RNA polymerase sigma factor (sigma-70 family)